MIKTYLQAAKVHQAYSANSFIYYLKKFPIIGKLIGNKEYGGGIIKILAKIQYYFGAFIKIFIFDWLYLGIVCMFALQYEHNFGGAFETVFPLIILGLLPVGILLNNSIFSAEQDKYYDLFIFRMNARELVLANLYARLIKMAIGYSTAFLIICKITSLSPLTAVLITLAAILGKFIGITARTYATMHQKETEFIGFTIIILMISVVVVAALVFFKVAVPALTINCILGTLAIAGVAFAPKVIFYKDYEQLCKYFFKPENIFVNNNEKANNTTKTLASQNITFEGKEFDATKTSSKSGFAYFNHLFVLRHKKLLAKKTLMICILSVVLWLVLMGFAIVNRIQGNVVLEHLDSAYKGLLLIPIAMYFINQGDGLVQAMFFNCDNAMLTYNFYRQPENILGVFKERLKTIIRYNSLIAAAISLEGLIWAPIATNGNWLPLALIAVVLIFTTSILFSMHKLVLYYLLQPFTDGIAAAKPSWGLVNTATYIVCFSMAQMMDEINPTVALYIALGVIAFSLIYFVVALILVKKFAPTKFRLNK